MRYLLLVAVIFTMSHVAFAEDNVLWQCRASDSTSKQWSFESTYERVALNRAYDTCKKESSQPESCRVSNENCDVFAHGISRRHPLWQCTALDGMAKAWKSAVSSGQDDAALKALARCRRQSRYPDSCYVNVITCRR